MMKKRKWVVISEVARQVTRLSKEPEDRGTLWGGGIPGQTFGTRAKAQAAIDKTVACLAKDYLRATPDNFWISGSRYDRYETNGLR